MRSYIFTDRERRLLEAWIETGEENGETRKVLSWIRKGFLGLAEDIDLMFRAIRMMQRQHRWREDHRPQRVGLSFTPREVRFR